MHIILAKKESKFFEIDFFFFLFLVLVWRIGFKTHFFVESEEEGRLVSVLYGKRVSEFWGGDSAESTRGGFGVR